MHSRLLHTRVTTIETSPTLATLYRIFTVANDENVNVDSLHVAYIQI